jgi:hypothetical protein
MPVSLDCPFLIVLRYYLMFIRIIKIIFVFRKASISKKLNISREINVNICFYRWRVVNYFTTRVQANLQIMEQVDLIGRTSEFARVFGIEFYHVLSRGSV